MIYTKELYKEMQVYGFLVFPPSKEEWEEMIQSYKDMGIDYINLIKNDLEFQKEDLLKYLPESMHPSIHNKTLRIEYPSSQLREIVTEWRKNFEDKLRKIRKFSREHYEKLKHELPVGFVQLHENSLHDADVISFTYLPDKQECKIILNPLEEGVRVVLTFTGVIDLVLEKNIEEAIWLYDELSIDGDYYEVHVLFGSPLTEFYIKTQNLKVEKLILD